MNKIDVYLKAVGANIRFHRKQKGLSHQALADLIGTHKGAILRLEKAESGITLRTALKVAAALDISPTDLLHTSIKVDRSDLK